MKKQPSFWTFLEDIKRENYKEGKDLSFNLLFWDHFSQDCNGMIYLQKPFLNVKQRMNFTSEEYVHVKS